MTLISKDLSHFHIAQKRRSHIVSHCPFKIGKAVENQIFQRAKKLNILFWRTARRKCDLRKYWRQISPLPNSNNAKDASIKSWSDHSRIFLFNSICSRFCILERKLICQQLNNEMHHSIIGTCPPGPYFFNFEFSIRAEPSIWSLEWLGKYRVAGYCANAGN